MATRIVLEQTRPTGHGRARGLVSNRASGQRIGAHTYLPSPELRDLVAAYWTGSWDLRGQEPHTTQMLGDPCVHLVFERGPSGDSARVVGVWTRLWRRTLEGLGSVRGVKIRAGAVRAFVNAPAVSLANRIVPFQEMFPDTEALQREVFGARDDEEAFGALEAWLRARAVGSVSSQLRDVLAWVDRIARRSDLTTARQLADDAGLPLRTLQRLFREYLGASPKWVIRRNRLQEVAMRIERGSAPTLAVLAAELGYADHAHLARDFKSVVGQTPSAFAASVRRVAPED